MRYAETRDCRRALLLAFFGERLVQPCGHCDNCVRVPLTRSPLAVPRVAAEPIHDPSLLNLLRVRRKELADLIGVPADTIFSDRTLLEMATVLPQDEGQLSAIDGVGEARLANYGETFLRAIRDYCARHGLSPRPPGPRTPARPIATGGRKWRSVQTGELFAAGRTIEEIAAFCGVQRQTILVHLHRFHEAGGQVDAGRLLEFSRLSEADRPRVFATFESLGMEQLAPVHEALGGAIGYDELYLLRLYALCRGKHAPS